MAVSTRVPNLASARAEAVRRQLAYRSHYEGCWRCGLRLECLNERVLDREADLAWQAVDREREAMVS